MNSTKTLISKKRSIQKTSIPQTAILELKAFGEDCFTMLQPVTTYQEASEICSLYINELDLGGSTFEGGAIYHPTLGIIARVSYNGRVWKCTKETMYALKNEEITNTNQSIL